MPGAVLHGIRLRKVPLGCYLQRRHSDRQLGEQAPLVWLGLQTLQRREPMDTAMSTRTPARCRFKKCSGACRCMTVCIMWSSLGFVTASFTTHLLSLPGNCWAQECKCHLGCALAASPARGRATPPVLCWSLVVRPSKPSSSYGTSTTMQMEAVCVHARISALKSAKPKRLGDVSMPISKPWGKIRDSTTNAGAP